MYDPLIALTTVASVTKTLKVGTGVALVPLRDPIILAKEVASLDVLSGGRLLFGVGAGWVPGEMRNHHQPGGRWALMQEKVLAMKEIWTQEEAEFQGQYINIEPIWQWPKPQQKPHPPILVGGHGQQVLKRVLAYGDGWFPHPMPILFLA